jgi:arylsulfatase A-like enzyme
LIKINLLDHKGDMSNSRRTIIYPTGSKHGFFYWILTCLLIVMTSCQEKTPSPNVLFISVDDWNDWVGCLGDSVVQTPNLDRLSKMGMLFTNAHCAAPVCNPSRASLMTGLLPSTTGVYNNAQPIFATHPDLVSIPRHFKNNEYLVEGGGKTYHEQIGFNNPGDWDYYFLWDEGNRENGWWGQYGKPPAPQPVIRPEHSIADLTVLNFDWSELDVPDHWMPDFKVASWARYFLSRKHDRPFFLATGIFKPHIPWYVPKEYFDLYNIDDIELPPYNPDDLEDIPEAGREIALDHRSKHDKVVEMGLWKDAIRAYYASISHSDRQVGRILEGLEKSDYLENTIIVLWSDHGYHLGEKDHWHKLTLWERATRVPLIIVAPGITTPGSVCNKSVSLVDLYPTLIELCDLPAKPELDGHSLVSLLRDPEAEWEYPAITTRDKNNHAIRTEQFRYIRYNDGTEELYDHFNDSNEWTNLADEEHYREIKSDLSKWLPAENAEDALHKTRDLIFNKEEYKWYPKQIVHEIKTN